jgi:YD repeat-containing protein
MAGGLFRNALDRIFENRATAIPKMESFSMKKVNGSECTCDGHGQITVLKDAEGRTWEFTYENKQLIEFTDPQGNVWVQTDGRWTAQRVVPGFPTPKEVSINHATGEIRIEDVVRTTVYFPDGTSQVEVMQSMDGAPVKVRFTEYPTRPHRAFVVQETHGGSEYVTWIQDANSKLFKLEYDRGRLQRYIDMSAKPAIVWSATYDATGTISSWQGNQKGNPNPIGVMQPVLQSVDANGNRNFKSASGTYVVVDPSGTAFARKQQGDTTVSFGTPFPLSHFNY